MKHKTKPESHIKKDYGKAVKMLQIFSVALIVLMLMTCLVLINKYDISIKNIYNLQTMITGGAVTVALGIIVFSIVKSFALVFPPAVIFALSGLLFGNVWIALGVNFVSTFLSLILPYYLGVFTGKPMLDSLKKRFVKIKKIDDFAQVNDFSLVLILKVSGILGSDLSSLIFGAMGIKFKPYFIASNLGLLPLNIMWTLLGVYGDLTDPKSILFLIPIVTLAIIGSTVAKKLSNKKEKITV
ncbi:MAG TPA: VTT domain-containing protein [Clostridia bacterium]|nr:VTT domain-containing protein [Clostridia bacterium]